MLVQYYQDCHEVAIAMIKFIDYRSKLDSSINKGDTVYDRYRNTLVGITYNKNCKEARLSDENNSIKILLLLITGMTKLVLNRLKAP